MASRTRSRDRERERLGLTGRYLVYSGRYDARQDLATLLRALVTLAAAGRPSGLPKKVPWPPRILLVGASPEDRASLARAASRQGIGESLAYAQQLTPEVLAGLVRGARAAILPVVSDSTGLPALEAIAAGTPVVASAVGALPDIVGGVGHPRRTARGGPPGGRAPGDLDRRPVPERLRLKARETGLRWIGARGPTSRARPARSTRRSASADRAAGGSAAARRRRPRNAPTPERPRSAPPLEHHLLRTRPVGARIVDQRRIWNT